MANPNDPPKQPTVADMMELVKSMQEGNLKMVSALGDTMAKNLKEGLAMAEMARVQADLNMENARHARRNLGATCHKCRMPVKVCGGPEMKTVPKLDNEGKPMLADGKPVTMQVEATKASEADANHVKMVVLPSDANAAKWFQWIGINGVRFASRGRGQAILVPRKNDFAAILNTFTNFETDFRGSRKVRFNQGHRASPKPIHFHNVPTAGRGARLAS